MPRREKARSLTYRRLMLRFIGVILPLLLLGTAMLLYVNQRLSDQMQQKAIGQISLNIGRLDAELERIYEQQLNFVQDNDLCMMAYAGFLYNAYDVTQKTLLIQNKMTAIRHSSALIHNMSAHISTMNRTINAEGKQVASFQILNRTRYDRSLAHLKGGEGRLLLEGDRWFLLAAPGLINPVYLVEVELSQAALADALQATVLHEQGVFALFTYRGARLLHSAVREPLATELAQATTGGQVSVLGERHAVVRVELPALGAYVVMTAPTSYMMGPIRLSTGMTVLYFIAVLLCVIGFFRMARQMINEPMVDLVQAFQTAGHGELKQVLPEEVGEFSYLYRGFNEMSQQLSELIAQVYEQQLLLKKAELKQLQAQIAPHFLYNSYFLLHRMIKHGQQEQALRVSKGLGVYFRYITRNGADIVTLFEEDEHAHIYAQLQALRFEGRIRVAYGALPAACAGIRVPRLILQPLIENAFSYGLESCEDAGLLRVGYELRADACAVHVEDNGLNLTDERLADLAERMRAHGAALEGQEPSGLTNIHRRVRIFCGEAHGLTFARSELGGLHVTLSLWQNGGEVNASAADCG